MRVRALLFAGLLFTSAGAASADEAPDPPEERPARPGAAEPSRVPDPPKNAACGVGAGLAVFGIGVFGAWRLSKTRQKAQPA